MHDKYFLYVFDSFILVIMLNTHVEHTKSSVLFGTDTLLDKLLKVLQFPTHLSNLTTER